MERWVGGAHEQPGANTVGGEVCWVGGVRKQQWAKQRVRWSGGANGVFGFIVGKGARGAACSYEALGREMLACNSSA
eukprot:222929-Pelagomonas_calceolata.AAC.6